MIEQDYNELLKEWLTLKQSEKELSEKRITLEKSILKDFGITEHLKETSYDYEKYELVLKPSITKTVDAEILKKVISDNFLQKEFKESFIISYKKDTVKFKKLNKEVQDLFNTAVVEKVRKPTFYVTEKS